MTRLVEEEDSSKVSSDNAEYRIFFNIKTSRDQSNV